MRGGLLPPRAVRSPQSAPARARPARLAPVRLRLPLPAGAPVNREPYIPAPPRSEPAVLPPPPHHRPTTASLGRPRRQKMSLKPMVSLTAMATVSPTLATSEEQPERVPRGAPGAAMPLARVLPTVPEPLRQGAALVRPDNPSPRAMAARRARAEPAATKALAARVKAGQPATKALAAKAEQPEPASLWVVRAPEAALAPATGVCLGRAPLGPADWRASSQLWAAPCIASAGSRKSARWVRSREPLAGGEHHD